MSAPKSLMHNFLSMLGGTLGGKVLALLSVLMLTRYLGVAEFGQYSLVFSVWALLNTMVDFGGTALLTREITKNPAGTRASIESVIYLRLLACVLLIPGMVGFAYWMHLDNAQLVLIVFGLFAWFEAFYDNFFTATGRLDRAAKSRFLASVWNVSLIALAILLRAPLTVILFLAFANPLIKLVFDLRMSESFEWRLSPPRPARIREFARDGWSLWLLGILYILLARVDIFMLEALSTRGSYDLGIYSAAYRISEVLALLVNALSPAMLPLLVKAMDDARQINFLTRTGTRVVLTALILASLLIFWLAPWVIYLAYGAKYEGSTLCLQILVWSQALVAVNTLCTVVMMVYNVHGRRPWVLTSVGIVLMNIALNFWLIPRFHAVGASAATLATELVGTIGLIYFLQRLTPVRLLHHLLLLEVYCLIALALPLMLGATTLLGALMSASIFMALVVGFKTLTPADVRRLAGETLSSDPSPPTSP